LRNRNPGSGHDSPLIKKWRSSRTLLLVKIRWSNITDQRRLIKDGCLPIKNA
jgi:hypothetical protein